MKNLPRRPPPTPPHREVHPPEGVAATHWWFEVHRDATKPEIRKAVETLFDTKVANVRVARECTAR